MFLSTLCTNPRVSLHQTLHWSIETVHVMPRATRVARHGRVVVTHVFAANSAGHVSVAVERGRRDTDQLACLSVQLVTPKLKFLLTPNQNIPQMIKPGTFVPIWRLGNVVVVADKYFFSSLNIPGRYNTHDQTKSWMVKLVKTRIGRERMTRFVSQGGTIVLQRHVLSQDV